MKKSDIQVTTPEKSVIYASGTAKKLEDIYAEEGGWRYSRFHQKTYVLYLAEKDSSAIILVNDGKQENSYQSVPESEQATPLEALDYTLDDWKARNKVLAQFSHWPLSPEQTVLRDKAIAKLKTLPRGWSVKRIECRYIVSLWAEYDIKREEYRAAERAKRDAQVAAEKEVKAEHKLVSEKLVALGLEQADKHNSYMQKGIYAMPVSTALALIEMAAR